jgi:hypothetical protein
MKSSSGISLATLALLWASPCTGLAANTYYPYQTYDEYYKKHATEPPQPAPSGQPAQTEVKPPPRPEQPITVTEPPEFLFPAKLGFGVAVGVPYDMFYTSGRFYLLKGDTWYRSASYRGPWAVQGKSQLPPELRKHKVAEIRQQRNREFADFWKNRDHYQGRHFRPEIEVSAPAPKEVPKP